MTTHHTDEKKPAQAGVGLASCKLAKGDDGRFYIEASTSDGEAALHKMLAIGSVVTVALAPNNSAATGVA